MAERVWDRYLSEQDRAHCATTSERHLDFGSRPALLLIDLYRWVFGDQPEPLLESVKKWPGSCGLAGWESLPHIQRLLGAAREAGIPVIYTTGLEAPLDGWAKSERSGGPRARGTDPESIERWRRRNDIVPEVAPRPDEYVIYKPGPSAFHGTPLVHHLISRGIDTVIVAGESTSGCVRSAVVDGCTYRFRMMVVEECVFDRHEAPHAINLFDMNQKYAEVTNVARTVAYLANVAGQGSLKNGSTPTPELVAAG